MPEIYWAAVEIDPTLAVHYWIARDLNLGYDPDDQILCIKMKGETLGKDFRTNVTTEEALTTCQQCQEWLHA